MKILILSHPFYPSLGGIEINSEILSHSLTDMNNEVHLVTWTEYEGLNKFPYTIIRSPSIRQLFAEHHWADVILENNPCLRLAWPNLFFRKTSVVVLNTWVSRVNGQIAIQDRLKFLWLKRADRVIAVSKAIKDASFKDAVVIGNPYRVENFRLIKTATRVKDFVFLGRLVSDKGANLAIQAFEKLFRDPELIEGNRPKSLTIIGEGPDLQPLVELTNRLGLNDVVEFTGSLTGADLATCLNEHKYLIVPSQWKEPFGNVALEGLACGCIPIVSDGGGLPEAVGSAGLAFERGNLQSLISTLKTLLNSSTLQIQLRANAESHLQNHRPEVVGAKYLDILVEACTRKLDKQLQTSFK